MNLSPNEEVILEHPISPSLNIPLDSLSCLLPGSSCSSSSCSTDSNSSVSSNNSSQASSSIAQRPPLHPIPPPAKSLKKPVLGFYDSLSEKYPLSDVYPTIFLHIYPRLPPSSSSCKHTTSSLDILLDTPSESTLPTSEDCHVIDIIFAPIVIFLLLLQVLNSLH